MIENVFILWMNDGVLAVFPDDPLGRERAQQAFKDKIAQIDKEDSPSNSILGPDPWHVRTRENGSMRASCRRIARLELELFPLTV